MARSVPDRSRRRDHHDRAAEPCSGSGPARALSLARVFLTGSSAKCCAIASWQRITMNDETVIHYYADPDQSGRPENGRLLQRRSHARLFAAVATGNSAPIRCCAASAWLARCTSRTSVVCWRRQAAPTIASLRAMLCRCWMRRSRRESAWCVSRASRCAHSSLISKIVARITARLRPVAAASHTIRMRSCSTTTIVSSPADHCQFAATPPTCWLQRATACTSS